MSGYDRGYKGGTRGDWSDLSPEKVRFEFWVYYCGGGSGGGSVWCSNAHASKHDDSEGE